MRTRERGVALVMVILVLLVLTVLGITAVLMVTQEDKTSSRQELQKTAFYAAEAGLRHGEQILQPVVFSANALTLFISHTPVADCVAAPPSSGSDPNKPVPPPATLPLQWDTAHLGTYLTDRPGGVVEQVNLEVVQAPPASASTAFLPANYGYPVRVYYTCYVRNNPDDKAPGGGLSPLVNYDSRLRLISVGFVTDIAGVNLATGAANVLAVKILEEELNWAGSAGGGYWQKDVDSGATNSSTWTGTLSGS